MTEDVYVNKLRLKYKSCFVEIKITSGEEGILHLDVAAPVTPIEKASFLKISRELNKLFYSGVRNRSSLIGKLDRIIGVEHDVFDFMKKVVSKYLDLG
jgi:hypothetical protein